MGNAKKTTVDRAVATVKTPMTTDAQKVANTQTTCQAMAQSPSWATATAVQAAAKVWQSEATLLSTNAGVIANLRAQLKTAEAKQVSIRRDWTVAKAQTLVSVTSFAAGSADVVQSFSLDVVTRARIGAQAVPANLVVQAGVTPGEAIASWTKGTGIHGFLLQHASDATNAATYSAVIPSTRPKHAVDGLPVGAPVSFRVAAIDPYATSGASAWSAWVVGNAR